MDLTDEQWAVLEPFLPEAERIPARKGGRPWSNPREVLHGVLGVLRTGAPWQDLPKRYPPLGADRGHGGDPAGPGGGPEGAGPAR